jgi:hypothetical protein
MEAAQGSVPVILMTILRCPFYRVEKGQRLALGLGKEE